MMMMMNNFKNKKTTITGLILAVLVGIQPLTTVEGFDIKKDWFQLILAGAIAVFGWLAQDSEINSIAEKNKKLKGE
jgi:hypothetical protein